MTISDKEPDYLNRRNFLKLLSLSAGATFLSACQKALFLTSPSPEPSIPSNIKKPNIVLIISDDQTYESLGRMPYMGTQTNNWYKFTQAFTNVSLCCPSRAAMLTGQFSHHNQVEDNMKADRFNTEDNLITRLNDSGYHTALIGKYLNGWHNLGPLATPPGWDHFAAFVATKFYDYQIFEDGIVTSYGSEAADYSTDVVGQKALDFIATAQEPFFLQFSPYAAHGPFTPAPRHLGADVGAFIKDESFNEADVSDKPLWIQGLPTRIEASMETMRLNQYRQLLSLDEWVKEINDLLVQKGILKNTVIIYVSDNSLAFGEHRLIGKTGGYDICNHIPLLIHYPDHRGRPIERLVSNVDIAPTIAELAGIQLPGSDGISLVPLLEKPANLNRKGLLIHWAGEESVFVTPAFWGIIEPEWKYMELATGEKELYDRINDPLELNNVARKPEYGAIQAQLQADLRALLSE